MRQIFLLAVNDKIDHLRHLESLYWKGRDISRNTPSHKKREKRLLEERLKLEYLKTHSILMCSDICGGSTDRNMIYIPIYDRWYCFECYNILIKSGYFS